MKKTNILSSIDSKFSDHYKALRDVQNDVWNQLKDYPFNLQSNEITEAVIARMDAFWYFNVYNTKQILQRNINTTAADFFTETCMFFIKTYLEGKYNVVVRSEVSIVAGKNAIRPDISIWHEEKLLAVIELKVNNGWKGKHIMSHLIERENQIHLHYPNAYFGVIAFWNFFNLEDPNWDSKFIGIKHFDERKSHPTTGARIENLLLEIEKKIERESIRNNF